MSIFGIEPDSMGVKQKPFIKDERYVNMKGGKKRLAKNLKNREYYTVGYPVLAQRRRDGIPVYEIWHGNGGETYEQALAYLEYRMAVFEAQVVFFRKTQKLPNYPH